MREQFIEKRFNSGTQKLIAQANAIIDGFNAQGFTLTLRQLYYQFVARGFIDNKIQEYKRLGSAISDARLAGLMDWNSIEDRVRYLQQIPHWPNPIDAQRHIVEVYAEYFWRDQTYAPEVWVEKDALIGVVARVCNEFRCPFFACRGYTSQSAQYEAAKRFQASQEAGKIPIVFHLGDHDPSGMHMTEDNRTRLALLSRFDVELRRLALNYDQVQQYNPPPNPSKDKDTRSPAYRQQFGNSCWELDALDPSVIDGLIRDALTGIVDTTPWEKARKREASNRKILAQIVEQWPNVSKMLKRKKKHARPHNRSAR